MRLDRNSLTLFNYALMGVFVLVLTVTDAYADIYENAQNPVSAGTSQSCDTGTNSASQWLASLNSDRPYTVGDATYERYTIVQNNTEFFPPSTVCEVQLQAKAFWYKDNGEIQYDSGYSFSSKNLRGSVEEVPSCENLGNNPDGTFTYPDHKILHKTQDGVNKCFTPQSLADADTCEAKDANNAYESHMSKDSGVSCLEKEDGSICPVKFGTSITLNSDGSTYNFYSFDSSKSPDTCYKTDYVDPPQSEDAQEITSNLPANQGQCERINGIDTGMICNENPSNVCDQYGNCNEGCGTIQSDGEPIFACFSEDFDQDGVPDFKDPDRDGDGIHNDQDTDKDGDGIDDAEYTYGSGGGNSLSTLESLLGQIAQNTQGGSGGGGSGNSQGVIDAIGELGEQIEESTNVTIGTKGTLFTQSEAEAEIQEATEKLNAKIQEIKDHFSGMFSIGSGTGSFSGCFDIAQINGSKHGGCIDEYADEMSMVAIALLFIFALISVVIILR